MMGLTVVVAVVVEVFVEVDVAVCVAVVVAVWVTVEDLQAAAAVIASISIKPKAIILKDIFGFTTLFPPLYLGREIFTLTICGDAKLSLMSCCSPP